MGYSSFPQCSQHQALPTSSYWLPCSTDLAANSTPASPIVATIQPLLVNMLLHPPDAVAASSTHWTVYAHGRKMSTKKNIEERQI
jgi:hypothetical protein